MAEVEESILDLKLFSKLVKFKSFLPFKDAQDALANVNDVSEGIVNDSLRSFLELNLPKVKEGKKAKFWLGVTDPKLGNSIYEGLGIPCKCEDITRELIRGIRNHFHRFVKELDNGNQERAQLGLGHSYSRCKVKFNVNRNDNMIIQAICLLDLDTMGPMSIDVELGDAWRSWCNPAGEDEGSAHLDLSLFEASASAYLAHHSLSPQEREGLVPGVERIALELAARFAIDALEERYFGFDPQGNDPQK